MLKVSLLNWSLVTFTSQPVQKCTLAIVTMGLRRSACAFLQKLNAVLEVTIHARDAGGSTDIS